MKCSERFAALLTALARHRLLTAQRDRKISSTMLGLVSAFGDTLIASCQTFADKAAAVVGNQSVTALVPAQRFPSATAHPLASALNISLQDAVELLESVDSTEVVPSPGNLKALGDIALIKEECTREFFAFKSGITARDTVVVQTSLSRILDCMSRLLDVTH